MQFFRLYVIVNLSLTSIVKGLSISQRLPFVGGSTNKNENNEISNGLIIKHEKKDLFFDHLGSHRQYWRDIMLGVNDGLVSTFLLVAGVSGGKLDPKDILLTALAGSLAGAISMAAGEFVATKSQDEVIAGEIALENHHITHHKKEELRELDILLDKIGLPLNGGDRKTSTLRKLLKEYYHNSDEALLKIMIALEFGVLEDERRNPFGASAFSGLLFIIGSMPSVLPFIFLKDSNYGLICAAFGTGAGLVAAGIVKSLATRSNFILSAIENLLIASAGGAIAYWVGDRFESFMRSTP